MDEPAETVPPFQPYLVTLYVAIRSSLLTATNLITPPTKATGMTLRTPLRR